ncbi:unnamed protein product [Amoebophrya sp. A25]|nr:unnamed protein product [Amoebophrya sp. A25]|eukprot:GSA25T00010465001.1
MVFARDLERNLKDAVAGSPSPTDSVSSSAGSPTSGEELSALVGPTPRRRRKLHAQSLAVKNGATGVLGSASICCPCRKKTQKYEATQQETASRRKKPTKAGKAKGSRTFLERSACTRFVFGLWRKSGCSCSSASPFVVVFLLLCGTAALVAAALQLLRWYCLDPAAPAKDACSTSSGAAALFYLEERVLLALVHLDPRPPLMSGIISHGLMASTSACSKRNLRGASYPCPNSTSTPTTREEADGGPYVAEASGDDGPLRELPPALWSNVSSSTTTRTISAAGLVSPSTFMERKHALVDPHKALWLRGRRLGLFRQCMIAGASNKGLEQPTGASGSLRQTPAPPLRLQFKTICGAFERETMCLGAVGRNYAPSTPGEIRDWTVDEELEFDAQKQGIFVYELGGVDGAGQLPATDVAGKIIAVDTGMPFLYHDHHSWYHSASRLYFQYMKEHSTCKRSQPSKTRPPEFATVLPARYIRQEGFGICGFYALLQNLIRLGWLSEVEAVSPVGLYKVPLFIKGKWRDIIVDDRIPEMLMQDEVAMLKRLLIRVTGSCGCFDHAMSGSRSITVTVLIKAYAKVVGDYTAAEAPVPAVLAQTLLGPRSRGNVFEAMRYKTWVWNAKAAAHAETPLSKRVFRFSPSLVVPEKDIGVKSLEHEQIFEVSNPEKQAIDPRVCRLWVSPLDRVQWLVLKLVRRIWKKGEAGRNSFLAAWQDAAGREPFTLGRGTIATVKKLLDLVPVGQATGEHEEMRKIANAEDRSRTRDATLVKVVLGQLHKELYGNSAEATDEMLQKIIEDPSFTVLHRGENRDGLRKCAYFRLRSRFENLDEETALESGPPPVEGQHQQTPQTVGKYKSLHLTVVSWSCAADNDHEGRRRALCKEGTTDFFGMFSAHGYTVEALEVFAIPFRSKGVENPAEPSSDQNDVQDAKFLLVYGIQVRNPYGMPASGVFNAFFTPHNAKSKAPAANEVIRGEGSRGSDSNGQVSSSRKLIVRTDYPCYPDRGDKSRSAKDDYQCSTGDALLHAFNAVGLAPDGRGEWDADEQQEIKRRYSAEAVKLRHVALVEHGVYKVRMDCGGKVLPGKEPKSLSSALNPDQFFDLQEISLNNAQRGECLELYDEAANTRDQESQRFWIPWRAFTQLGGLFMNTHFTIHDFNVPVPTALNKQALRPVPLDANFEVVPFRGSADQRTGHQRRPAAGEAFASTASAWASRAFGAAWKKITGAEERVDKPAGGE